MNFIGSVVQHTEQVRLLLQLSFFYLEILSFLSHSNPRNCRLPVYVSFLFATPRMSNLSLFVLIRVASNWCSVQLRPYSCLIGYPGIETSVTFTAVTRDYFAMQPSFRHGSQRDKRRRCQAPELWQSKVHSWFAHAGAQFVTSGVTASLTKYYYVIKALPESSIERIDVLCLEEPAHGVVRPQRLREGRVAHGTAPGRR